MWRKIDTQVPLMPSMRSLSAATMLKGKLWVFGGLGAGPVQEMWCFDMERASWTLIRASDDPTCITPEGRSGHTLSSDPNGRLLWLYGGQSGMSGPNKAKQSGRVKMIDRRTYCTDMWHFDTEKEKGNKWSKVFCQISPGQKRGHSATIVVGRSDHIPAANQHSRTGSRSSVRSDFYDNGSSIGSLTEHNHHQAPGSMTTECAYREELFIIGGAGGAPGGRFESVLAQLWIFDLRAREWKDETQRCSGALPSKWGRFEHTATLVKGGMCGASAKQTIVVVGGIAGTSTKTTVADPSEKLGSSRAEITASGNSKLGGPENSVMALDVETLTWTELQLESSSPHATIHKSSLPTDQPEDVLSSSFVRALDAEESFVYAPALHGHAAAISPCNPREIIIFGGRGGIEWFDHVYLLKLPPPHKSGMTYPNMPTAKRGVQEKLAIDRTASSSHPDEGGRNNIVIGVPKAIIQWEILSEVTFDRSNGATAPPALRYGHVMVAYSPPSEEEKMLESLEYGLKNERKDRKDSGANETAARLRSYGSGSFGASFGQNTGDLAPTTPGVILFGGSLLADSRKIETSRAHEIVTGYATGEIMFLDLGAAQEQYKRLQSMGGSYKAREYSTRELVQFAATQGSLALSDARSIDTTITQGNPQDQLLAQDEKVEQEEGIEKYRTTVTVTKQEKNVANKSDAGRSSNTNAAKVMLSRIMQKYSKIVSSLDDVKQRSNDVKHESVVDQGGMHALPSNYSQMKIVLLGQRPDREKRPKQHKGRTAPKASRLSLSAAEGSILSQTPPVVSMAKTYVASNGLLSTARMDQTTGKTLFVGGGATIVSDAASTTTMSGGGPGSLAAPLKGSHFRLGQSSSDYRKMRRRATCDEQRYGYTAEDMKRSDIMRTVLESASGRRLQKAPLSPLEQRSNQPLEPLFGSDPMMTRSDALRAMVALPGKSQTRRILARVNNTSGGDEGDTKTADDANWKKERARIMENWKVPGTDSINTPTHRDIVTRTEAQRRYFSVLEYGAFVPSTGL